MKAVWYILVVALGAFGALGILRGAERLMVGAGIGPSVMQLAIGLVFLLLAWKSLQKARAG